MFEYVKLRNYKSFGNLEFNLLDRNNNPKKMILIYGENGIGKSNLASAFFMLSETLRTMYVRDMLESLLSDESDKTDNVEHLKRFLKTRFKDIETLITENKMVASTEPMCLEFGFNVNGKSGKYILEMNDSQIIHERLEYLITKRRGIYFDITPDAMNINTNIFLNRKAYTEIKKDCNKFWGKHSFLAILLHEADDKADSYIKDKIADNFSNVLDFLTQISCKVKVGSRQERGIIGLPHEILRNYENGDIDSKDASLLDNTEKMLGLFLQSTNKDIVKAYYKKTHKEDRISYSLMLKKKIAGKNRDINFDLESTGTQALIQQLPFMLVGVNGSVAVIDEFDTGIHDILIKALATSLYNNTNGQLIITTHNTLLMEAEIPRECIYVINETEDNEKEVHCILHYNNKLGDRNNVRKQYHLGKYSGIPEDAEINFKNMLNAINL